MGFEKGDHPHFRQTPPRIHNRIQDFPKLDPEILRNFLKKDGIPPTAHTPWFLNLSRDPKSQLDLISNNKRRLVYAESVEDNQADHFLKANNIPVFKRVPETPKGLVALEVPVETKPLTQVVLKEQAPLDATDIGAMEISFQVGRLLGQIKKRAGLLPQHLDLSSLALTMWVDDFIQLVPPIALSKDVTIDDLIAEFRRDIDAKFPAYPHDKHQEALREGFQDALTQSP